MPQGDKSISGLVVEYIVAIDVTRVRFPADAFSHALFVAQRHGRVAAAFVTRLAHCAEMGL